MKKLLIATTGSVVFIKMKKIIDSLNNIKFKININEVSHG